MFCFLSRRVSIAAIFTWSLAVMLCSTPVAASPIPEPLDSRLASIISSNKFYKFTTGLFAPRAGVEARCRSRCLTVDATTDSVEPSTTVTFVTATPVATPSSEPESASEPESPAEAAPEPVVLTSGASQSMKTIFEVVLGGKWGSVGVAVSAASLGMMMAL
ncbi:hypothetical protein SISNIDRAFT_240062 [Sistotremastrum niveocremeum HHB9708]|uniref:Uncharacterized protein n=1 Tax=Sistotremastrum niveocremeum HHB9708 TaxID=1314777 RepID=A0A164PMZ4_9AGAM|nr:hypothetical protein SISNIDRAFT_240062 [Sistotremastrum niveocremeum HHB9708]